MFYFDLIELNERKIEIYHQNKYKDYHYLSIL
jgi:hypothetical protein